MIFSTLRSAILLLLLSIPASLLAFNPQAGDFSKTEPTDVRIVSYNLFMTFLEDSSTDAPYTRVFQTLAPDVIALQELDSNTPDSMILNFFDETLPYGEGSWEIHRGIATGNIQNAIVSRYPITMRRMDTFPTSDARGVTIGLINLPDDLYEQNIYLMAVHFKCCNSNGTENPRRQRHADAIAAWQRTARSTGGSVTLPQGTPMIALGDFNLVGGPGGDQPEQTLITGDIQDTNTFGPASPPDWDGSNALDVTPQDPFTGGTNTWRSTDTNPRSRLDRFFITDSVVTVRNSFILNTNSMNSTQLSSAGLQPGDTRAENTSDHLPIAMDLVLELKPQPESNYWIFY